MKNQKLQHQINSAISVCHGRIENGAVLHEGFKWLEDEINSILQGSELYTENTCLAKLNLTDKIVTVPFKFISAIVLDKLNGDWITFFGASGHYIETDLENPFGSTKHISYDGCHVASRQGNAVSFNSTFKFPAGLKKAIKSL